jgi:hypothetical protein
MREEFQEIVIRQYFDVISNLIVECESLHRSNRPYCELDTRIRNLVSTAINDGLDESIVWGIVMTKLPDYYELTAVCAIAA